jgi:hypothetical protein
VLFLVYTAVVFTGGVIAGWPPIYAWLNHSRCRSVKR